MLEEFKQAVVKYALLADRSGLCKHRAGNFSLRDPQTGYICITPTGIDREELCFHDIIVIDSKAKVIEAQTGLKPTSEALMHLAVYQSRPEINAVAHTHSRFATSFAVLKKPIPAIVYEIFTLGCKEGYIPVAPYGRPGTPDLAQNIIKPLQISDVVLMESHGVLAVAQDLKEALLKASYAEELAEIYYRTLMLNNNQEPPTLPIAELKKWAYPKEIQLPEK